ncbi:MAG: hypothetical protein WCK27_10470 [Verrucomicrobiota bacterium]
MSGGKASGGTSVLGIYNQQVDLARPEAVEVSFLAGAASGSLFVVEDGRAVFEQERIN